MTIFVGLGNPGEKYSHSRHNTGWRTLDALAKALGTEDWKKEKSLNAETLQMGKTVLAKPQTFMNLSGNAVKETLKKYDSVITVEEAFLNNGGLDGLILKIIRDNRLNIRLQSLGFNDKYIFELGDRNHLHKLNNLDEESIIKTVKSVN